MNNLGDRLIDDNGNVVYFTESLIEMLYNGFIPSKILYPKDDIDVVAFNKKSYENFDDVEYTLPTVVEPNEVRRNRWFYPEKYDELNIDEYFDHLCQTLEEKNRVKLELSLYKEKGFEKFLRFCIYLSNVIQTYDLVISVGRGSSVSSYLLYLLKLHMVNSMEYNLDIREFLK